MSLELLDNTRAANLSLAQPGSFAQVVYNAAVFASDTTAYTGSVLVLTLPNSFLTISNTNFFLEIGGKDSTTGYFRILIAGRVLADGGTAASWVAYNVLTLVGTPPFSTVSFGMSTATPKTPVIAFGDGSTNLNYPTYVVEQLSLIGPTANTSYIDNAPMQLSIIPAASIAATYAVQTTLNVNILPSLTTTSPQVFSGDITTTRITTPYGTFDNLNARSNILIQAGPAAPPYSSGMVAESYGNGVLLDYGVNYTQLGNNPNSGGPATDSTMFGAYFRIDTRDAQASEMFSVSAIPTGAAGQASQPREQKVFKVDRSGNLYSGVNGTPVLTDANRPGLTPSSTPANMGYIAHTGELAAASVGATLTSGLPVYSLAAASAYRAAATGVTLALYVSTGGNTLTSAIFAVYLLSGTTWTQIGVSADSSGPLGSGIGIRSISIPLTADIPAGARLLIGVRVVGTTMPALYVTNGGVVSKFGAVGSGLVPASRSATNAAMPASLSTATVNGGVAVAPFAFGLS